MSRPPIHPGEILADELTEFEVSAAELARQIGVPSNRISQILHGKRVISSDTAPRLGHWFGMSAQFWMNPRSAHELRLAELEAGARIKRLPQRPGRTA